jgi:hypothetical protein
MDAEDEDLDDAEPTPAGVPALGGERLSAALDASLAALDPDARDGALAALLGLYARELDGSAAVAARAARVAREVADAHGRESALYEQVQALQAALSRRQALDRIGARLHAGLVEMLGTPRARGTGKPAAPPAEDTGTGGALVKLRLASGAE